MDEPWSLSASVAAARIDQGAISAVEMAQSCLDRVDQVEGEVQAFIHLDRDHVLAQARALDERRRNGEPTGPLNGIPVALKDIIDTADYPTENGSPIYSGRRPDYDATVVARLRAAGAVIFGKAVTTELAFYHPGKTRNPHDQERTPGGSSSGSAAAVAAAMVPLALGSQTNGSVIRPAAFCGVFGFKPTHGLISRKGVLAHSRKLDHVGGFARSLDDLALLLDVIAGYDPEDPDSRALAAPDFRRLVNEAPPIPPRFAFVRTPIWDKADPETREAFEELAESLGDAARVEDLPEPYGAAWDDMRAIMTVDMAHYHWLAVEKSGDASSETLRKFLAEGRSVSAVRYLEALAKARRYAAGLAEVFEYYDAIITPAAPGIAPKGLASTGDPAFCSLWTMTGLPALSLPILQGEDGMPLGVQLVGASGRDGRLLRTANWLLQRLSEI